MPLAFSTREPQTDESGFVPRRRSKRVTPTCRQAARALELITVDIVMDGLDPLEAKPIVLLVLVQLKTVPATAPVKVIAVVAEPLHNT